MSCQNKTLYCLLFFLCYKYALTLCNLLIILLLWIRKNFICMQIWEEMYIIVPLMVAGRFARPPRTTPGAHLRLSCQRSLTWHSMWWRLLRSWAWCGNASTTAERTGDTSTRWTHERFLSRLLSLISSALCVCVSLPVCWLTLALLFL